MFTRRSALRGLLGIGVAASFPGCAAHSSNQQTDLLSEEEFLKLLTEEADPGWDDSERAILPSEVRKLREAPGSWNWWNFPQETRPQPVWAPFRRGIDYAHLAPMNLPNQMQFELRAHDLEWLAERNSFDLDPHNKKVVVGLRGCRIKNRRDDTGWGGVHLLEATQPNHKDLLCVIGVWDRDNGKTRFFEASTVPNVSLMWRQYLRTHGANLLPTGLYSYIVGPHRADSENRKQVGALRLEGVRFYKTGSTSQEVLVFRTLNDLMYDASGETEVWDRCVPYDNIHSAIFAQADEKGLSGGNGIKFSSAGCQIIKGAYELDGDRKFTTVPKGRWRDFRESCGLAHPPVMKNSTRSSDDKKRFQYMLLTGHETAIASTRPEEFIGNYRPIRIGSSGKLAEKAQEIVGAPMDGLFGPESVEHLIFRQREFWNVPQTGILSLKD